MVEVTGKIVNIRYRNDDNGWSVLSVLLDGGKTITAVGVVPHIAIGERVRITGSHGEHQIYGEQIKIDSISVDLPNTDAAMRDYLSSGLIKGVGKTTADLIVDRFGAETFEIIETMPMELTKISGIGPKKAKEIHSFFVENRQMQRIVIEMQQLGFSLNMTMKLYKEYGQECVERIKRNPYMLIESFQSIGFKTADSIANKVGFEADSSYRIKAGIEYALRTAAADGNTCVAREWLIGETANSILHLTRERIEEAIDRMFQKGELVESDVDGEKLVFLPYMYRAEMSIAEKLKALAADAPQLVRSFDIDAEIARLEKKHGITLAPLQREAVKRSVTDGILVITGGPGTGKTTIIRFIIEILYHLDMDIKLAAPTGRAAKRISETSGEEAKTIHRLLEYNAANEEFSRNEDYPIEAGAIIIDEMSMVDVFLMNALLKAVAPDSILIMVGDVDQLPSVGPGNVLKDIVLSGKIPVIRLNEIFRQSDKSSIVTNAHLVNNGNMPRLEKSDDFEFYECPNISVALNSVKNVCADYNDYGRKNEIQVLSPMKANTLGVKNLNAVLQNELNPPDTEKTEHKSGDTLYRVGDRVMQTRNNYDIEWYKPINGAKKIYGAGIFNGDIGTITEIDKDASLMSVLFDDERLVEYPFILLEDLELAYCISVHKSQGSEFPIVVLPLISGPQMLFNRNILYTAITRARERVYLFGTQQCIKQMIDNTTVRRRNSALKSLIDECFKATDE